MITIKLVNSCEIFEYDFLGLCLPCISIYCNLCPDAFSCSDCTGLNRDLTSNCISCNPGYYENPTNLPDCTVCDF